MERFRWSLKYEDLLIRSYESMKELRTGVDRYIEFYNRERIHSSLSYQTLEKVYNLKESENGAAQPAPPPVQSRQNPA